MFAARLPRKVPLSLYVAAGIVEDRYAGLICCIFGSSGVMSMNFTSAPSVVNRSVTPGVGRPPDQISPSMLPSFMPSTLLVRSSRWGVMSVSGSSPAD